MFNSTCQACGAPEVELPVKAFKGHVIFVWKENSIYQFAWLYDTDALIPRERVAGTMPVTECMVEANLDKMKGLNQFIKIFLIENPRSAAFMDDHHSPMRPGEEFSDLIERLSALAEKNNVEIHFLDSHNNKGTGGGF
jgi:hypothetical protein